MLLAERGRRPGGARRGLRRFRAGPVGRPVGRLLVGWNVMHLRIGGGSDWTKCGRRDLPRLSARGVLPCPPAPGRSARCPAPPRPPPRPFPHSAFLPDGFLPFLGFSRFHTVASHHFTLVTRFAAFRLCQRLPRPALPSGTSPCALLGQSPQSREGSSVTGFIIYRSQERDRPGGGGFLCPRSPGRKHLSLRRRLRQRALTFPGLRSEQLF